MNRGLYSSTFVQSAVYFSNRLLGVFVTALIFRIFDLSVIGEYFYIVSIFAILLNIQSLGAYKVLIKDYTDGNDFEIERLLFTRAFLSFLSALFFVSIAVLFVEFLEVYEVFLLAVALLVSGFNYDWMIAAKKKFIALSFFQFLAQVFVFFVFWVSYIDGVSVSIIWHQVLPVICLMAMFFVYCFCIESNVLKYVSCIYKGRFIAWEYFIENRFLMFSSFFLSFVSVVDYQVAKLYLSPEDLGVFAGFMRFAAYS